MTDSRDRFVDASAESRYRRLTRRQNLCATTVLGRSKSACTMHAPCLRDSAMQALPGLSAISTKVLLGRSVRAIPPIIDAESSSRSTTTVADLAQAARSRSDCARNAAATTPARLMKIAATIVSRATSSAVGGGFGHSVALARRVLCRLTSPTPPFTSDAVHNSGAMKVGWASFVHLQYELK